MKLYNLDELRKDIEKYNKLPDHLKLGKNYDKIKTKIDIYRKNLEKNINIVDNPEKYITDFAMLSNDDLENINIEKNDNIDNSKNIDKNLEFIEHLDKINFIKNEFKEEKDINKLIDLYIELYKLSIKCKIYLDEQKMEIKFV